jgi:NAD(P)-dependent dehydrogenase (short-subunit alcohol dehydrogenase family)
MASIPSALKTYHLKSYPTIFPGQPLLSTQGQTIVIAGVGNDNVGNAIARAFAESGAKNIALMGESASVLAESMAEIKASYPTKNVAYFITDASSTESVGLTAHHIRANLGAWDVFVQAACYSPVATTLVGADTDDWWRCFEQNIRPTQHFAKHFIPKKRPNATYISLVSRVVRHPGLDVSGLSAFAASQTAVLKVNEFLAAENPDLRVFNVDSGGDHGSKIVQKDEMVSGSRTSAGSDDIPALCGAFCVWLTSPEQDFLRSRFLWCNWDASELVEMKAALGADPGLLK